jgi:hypothetical protein
MTDGRYTSARGAARPAVRAGAFFATAGFPAPLFDRPAVFLTVDFFVDPVFFLVTILPSCFVSGELGPTSTAAPRKKEARKPAPGSARKKRAVVPAHDIDADSSLHSGLLSSVGRGRLPENQYTA